MATQVSDQNKQFLIDAGVDPNFVASELAKGKSGLAKGENIDTQDVQPFLDAWKSQTPAFSVGNFTVDANGVYHASNLNTAATAPATRPDLSDPLGIGQFYYDQLGIPTVQTDVQSAKEALSKFDENSASRQTYLENQAIALPVIRGEQATQLSIDANQRNALNNTLLAKTSLLSALTSEADRRTSEAKAAREELTQYINAAPGAGITYADTVEQAQQKAFKWQSDQAEKKAKDDYKASLKSALLNLGLKTSGNTKKLEERLRKANKEAQKFLKEQNKIALDTNKAQLQNLLKRSSGGSGLSASEIQTANENAIYNALSDARTARSQAEGSNWDGYLNPADWQPLLKMWTTAGGSATDFLAKFGGKTDAATGARQSGFINPNDL